MVHDQTELSLWHAFTRSWDEYRQLAEQVVRLSASGRKAEGDRLYLTRSRAAYASASDALGVLTERTVSGAREASNRAELIFRRTRSMIVLAIGRSCS